MLGLGTGINKLSSAEASSIASRSGGYLLDTYSGAAAAYSLRQLSSSYSGNAVKVRRSSDNTETDIGFVGGELDTASLSSFAGAGDAFVVSWFDQSSNSNDATQTTTSAQPQIVSSGAVIMENGKPSLNAVAKSLVNPLGAISQPCTVMGIFSSSNLYNYMMGGSVNFFHNGNDVRFLSNRIDNGGTFPKNTQTAILGVGNGASSFGKVINSINQPTSVSFSSTNQIDTTTFFARYLLNNGDNRSRPQEFIAWNDVKSTSEIADIETNINTFYNIY